LLEADILTFYNFPWLTELIIMKTSNAMIMTSSDGKTMFAMTEGTPKSWAKLANTPLTKPKLPNIKEITLKDALNTSVKVEIVESPSELCVAFCI